MKLRNIKFLFLFATISLAFLSSCTKEEEKIDLAAKVIEAGAVYNGTFVSGAYTSVDYNITISRIDETKIKITPEDSNGSSFEINLKEGADGKIETSEAGQFVFSTTTDNTGTVMDLVYNMNGDKFTGDNE